MTPKTLIAISLLGLACVAPTWPTQDEPVIIDQLEYFKALKRHRPDLIAKDCKNNLIIKTKYRNSVLLGATEYTNIRNEYSSSLQAIDKIWANGFRASASKLKSLIDKKIMEAGLDPANQSDARVWKLKQSLPLYVQDYPPDKFVGFHTGQRTDYDQDGLGRKLYLEFASAIDTITPEKLLSFMHALRRADFNGDAKIQLGPGVARFQMNNIVIHAGSARDATIAEQVARDFFRGKLISIGRGLDIRIGTKVFDWSRFLCTQEVTSLPEAAFQYLGYALPLPRATR